MKKYLLAALVALAFAVPGTVDASVVNVEQQIESAEMDPALVEAILRAAAAECVDDYCTLRARYVAGEVWIEKTVAGYRVSDGGGMILILIEDEL
ncbi:MAG: hypothetical protein AAGN35_23805 [Bacteroidota bacterium]